jgi:hypothetical protein
MGSAPFRETEPMATEELGYVYYYTGQARQRRGVRP